ncbi:MAG: tyrosine-type recombinase/integrase [Sphingobium sp.]|nr:tyrosine-type recombinase/integrase [Sphingobium sp.]MBP9158423.1 tyrosine-type recombinase/integrase [Sphingobium sp.]
MKRHLPRYVSEYPDRHGKFRLRFRRKGQATYYFRSKAGSDEFWREYAACLSSENAPEVSPGAGRVKHGTFDDLIERFYRSPNWQGMTKASSRKTYRSIIERFRERRAGKDGTGIRIGDSKVTDWRVEHLDAILGEMKETPAAANNLRKVLRRLFAYAVKVGMRADNPALLTDGYKQHGEGFHTWTEDEIATFEAHHPIGSKARLAMMLMLWTGQRRSDMIHMGRQHIEKGRIRVRQQKTGRVLLLLIAPQLQSALDAVPPGQMTFLVTEFGNPFTAAGFGNWFRRKCNDAGLPQCSAHGLRKAMSRRLAELGAKHSEGKAITGHVTDREFSRYAADADQARLADRIMANLSNGLATKSPKTLKKGA